MPNLTLQIPSTIEEITQMPNDEFNEPVTEEIEVAYCQQGDVSYVDIAGAYKLSRDTLAQMLDVLDDVNKLSEKI